MRGHPTRQQIARTHLLTHDATEELHGDVQVLWAAEGEVLVEVVDRVDDGLGRPVHGASQGVRPIEAAAEKRAELS